MQVFRILSLIPDLFLPNTRAVRFLLIQLYMLKPFDAFTIFVLAAIAMSPVVRAGPKDCRTWFSNAGIKLEGYSCVIDCSTIPVDMSTFRCPESCDDFCKIKKNTPRPIDQLTSFFGFNSEELKLIAIWPKKATKAYGLSKVANKMTDKAMKRNLPGDESDAFRHFVWAALMTRDLGAEIARKFLDAYESDEPSSSPDRAMDLANNQAGIDAAKKLVQEKKATDDNIREAAIGALRAKKLIVMKPKGVIP
jgi:hypothetical protein